MPFETFFLGRLKVKVTEAKAFHTLISDLSMIFCCRTLYAVQLLLGAAVV